MATSVLMSKNLAEATKKAVGLYRQSLKAIPEVTKAYQLEYTPEQMRNRIRSEFESHREVKETEVVDMLVFRGTVELQETTKMFKTKSHVCKMFAPATEISSEKPVPIPESETAQFDFTIPAWFETKFKQEMPEKWPEFLETYKKGIPTAEEITEMQQSLEEFFAGYQQH